MVVSDNELFAKEATEYFKKHGLADPSLKVSSFDGAVNQVALLGVPAVLIDLVHSSSQALIVVQKIQGLSSVPKIIGAGEPQDVPHLMKFIKHGVKDFLTIPFDDDEIRELIKKLGASSGSDGQEPAPLPKEKEAKIITFSSPKGGAGVTLLTANLSVILASHYKNRVVVCDLASQCGDIATYLNLSPHYTVRDIIDNSHLMDTSFLEGCLLSHVSGVKILAAPAENQEALSPDNLPALKSIFSLLKKSFDIILVDSSHLAPPLSQYVASNSDLVFLVGNPDVVSLKGLVGAFNKLREMHYDAQRIKVLINRHNSKSQIDGDEFEKMTRHPIAAYLPNNFMLCIEAVNTGQPITHIQEKSDLAKKISELAGLILRSTGLDSENNDPHSGSPRESLKKGLFRCF